MSGDGTRLHEAGIWVPGWQAVSAARVVRVAADAMRARGDEPTRAESDFIRGVLTGADKLTGPASDAPTAAIDRADILHSAIDADQAADRLGVTPERVRQLAKDRKLGGRQIGRVWAFDALEIDAYASERAAEKEPAAV
jgi:hypothetical protein